MKKTSLRPRITFKKHAQDAIETVPAFFKEAAALRAHFEKTFQNPLEAKPERFCWDYWNVKNQYRLLRTPAEPFFPKPLYQAFLNRLLSWGRETLGCQMISHPWLSAYIDGSFQNLHSDVPHGPFSFVYSLTPWKTRKFSGGETLVADPKLLRYFAEVGPGVSHEEKDLFVRVPPHFNQLTLFDPRYPHGVDRVNGVEDLLDARLVIHGWFTEPRPMIEGTLSYSKISKGMDEIAQSILDTLSPEPYSGLLTARFEIGLSGQVESIEVLTAHLVDSYGGVIPKPLIKKALLAHAFLFPVSKGKTRFTLPLQFETAPRE